MKAEVEIELKTTKATGQLRKLSRDAESSGKRMSNHVRQGFMGGAMGAVGGAIGARIGSARSRAAGELSAGVGDMLSESLGGYWEQFKDFAFQGTDLEASAKRATRDEAAQIFGYQAHMTGSNSAANAYIQQMSGIKHAQMAGARAIRMDDANRENVFTKLLERLIAALKELFTQLFNDLKAQIGLGSSGK